MKEGVVVNLQKKRAFPKNFHPPPHFYSSDNVHVCFSIKLLQNHKSSFLTAQADSALEKKFKWL